MAQVERNFWKKAKTDFAQPTRPNEGAAAMQKYILKKIVRSRTAFGRKIASVMWKNGGEEDRSIRRGQGRD